MRSLCSLFPGTFAEARARDALALVILRPRPGSPSFSTTVFSSRKPCLFYQHPYLCGHGLELCRKPGLEGIIRTKSIIASLHPWKQSQSPGQECVRTAKCSFSQLFLEVLTGRCGPTPLALVTQRLTRRAHRTCCIRQELEMQLPVANSGTPDRCQCEKEVAVPFLYNDLALLHHVPTP